MQDQRVDPEDVCDAIVSNTRGIDAIKWVNLDHPIGTGAPGRGLITPLHHTTAGTGIGANGGIQRLHRPVSITAIA